MFYDSYLRLLRKRATTDATATMNIVAIPMYNVAFGPCSGGGGCEGEGDRVGLAVGGGVTVGDTGVAVGTTTGAVAATAAKYVPALDGQ